MTTISRYPSGRLCVDGVPLKIAACECRPFRMISENHGQGYGCVHNLTDMREPAAQPRLPINDTHKITAWFEARIAEAIAADRLGRAA